MVCGASPERITSQLQHILGQNLPDVISTEQQISAVGLIHCLVAKLPHKVVPQLSGGDLSHLSN